MKKLRKPSHSNARLVACTVPAAALMLGVSQAATVGINFQANYCGAPSLSGYIVTSRAFGIGTNKWENLTQMDTGYGSCAGPLYTNLVETIDTTTSSDGLNPLPNGSLTIAWAAGMANVSGFSGGYQPGRPGEFQVYHGFLRDGVNFGPGSNGGDNSQPGYSIDITGLKSLFTNTPFVIQLIAASDSMKNFTNAFVIDATHSSTQSVVYPSPYLETPRGDTPWVRGYGGGLSTVTPLAVDADHVMIMGNRAAHGGDRNAVPPTDYNNASTIAGFIVTDVPLVTMSPNSVSANPADSVTLSAYAIGVPPLSLQWRKNGTPIPGATSLSYAIPSAGLADAGAYDLVASNALGQATSSVANVSVDRIIATTGHNYVADSNPNNPPHDGTETGATWAASNTDGANVTRSGVMQFNPATPSQIAVGAGGNLNSATGTILFWVRSAGLSDPSGHDGMLFDRRGGDGLVVTTANDGTITVQGANSAFPDVVSNQKIGDGNWHHVAVVYDQTASGYVQLFIDGNLDNQVANNPGKTWGWSAGQRIELGLSHDTYWQAFGGAMDDVRIYGRILTDVEIGTVRNSDALVDTSTLFLRFNFDTAPLAGVTLTWNCPDGILQSSDTVNGTYTDVPSAGSPYSRVNQPGQKFYRYRGHTPGTFVSNPYLM